MSIVAAFALPHPPLIIPAVGRGQEAGIQDTINAYDEVARRIANIAPETIVVSSPHATAYRDWFHISPGTHAHGDMLRFSAHNTDLEVDYDDEFSTHLCAIARAEGFPAGTEGERDPELDHASYIPLWFIQKFYTDFKAVRIGLSGFDCAKHYEFGELIARCAQELDRPTVFVASGDLSHKLTVDGPYGFASEGPLFDEQICDMFARGDFGAMLAFDENFTDRAAECGLRSFQIMAGALDGKAVKPELLSHEGPFGVGYGVAAFSVEGDDDTRHFCADYVTKQAAAVEARRVKEDPWVQLARASVEAWVRSGEQISIPAGLPDEMLDERAGVFVSLHEHGRLRGCIGTISPATQCVAQEIIRNGISACSADPRFDAVTPDELDQLEISVDVLGPTEDIESPDQLDVKRYGVVVSKGMRRGLLLPNLDGVDNVDEQIAIAKSKAGIGDYEDDIKLERFEVVRHEAH